MAGRQQLAASAHLGLHVPRLEPSQYGGLQPTETEVQRVALHPGEREPHRFRIAVGREHIDHRPPRIAEPEQLRYFVESFARGVVARSFRQSSEAVRDRKSTRL